MYTRATTQPNITAAPGHKNNIAPDFVLGRHQNFIMSELHSTQFRNKNIFEQKDRFCRHKKKNRHAVSQPGGQRENYLTPIHSFVLFTSVLSRYLCKGPNRRTDCTFLLKRETSIFSTSGNNIQNFTAVQCELT